MANAVGTTQTFTARVRLASAAPCLLTASVRSRPRDGTALGSIRGIYVNARTGHDTAKRGVTANGGKTIEAPAGR